MALAKSRLHSAQDWFTLEWMCDIRGKKVMSRWKFDFIVIIDSVWKGQDIQNQKKTKNKQLVISNQAWSTLKVGIWMWHVSKSFSMSFLIGPHGNN